MNTKILNLKTSFRLSPKMANIAIEFQNEFFDGKYFVDKTIETTTPETLDVKSCYKYLYYSKSDSLLLILEDIYSLIHQLNKHRNDICFLSPRVEVLREKDSLIRNSKQEKTKTIFESKEMYEKLGAKDDNQEIKKIRNSKKFHYWMNSGTVKLSTIYSFKGWEIDTLFLILESDDKKIAIDELVYTGITRARHNLIVVNIGNTRYHTLFQKITEDDC